MWLRLGQTVLKYRLPLLLVLLAATGMMGWYASKVSLSYEFAKAIPTDNPKYQAYMAFKEKFGEDGNLLVIGVTGNAVFKKDVFNDYGQLHRDLKAVPGVDDVLSVPSAIALRKDLLTERLQAEPLFATPYATQEALDTARAAFEQLPFYQGLLYNPAAKACLMGVRINKNVLNSKGRTEVVDKIAALADAFGAKHKLEVYKSGLPLIRTIMATRIANEMRWFLLGSVLLSALILLLFFRSFSAMLLSLAVVIIGVVCSMGTMQLLGYKITLLNALIPPLIVVIGIPNCIYFLNKYHASYKETGDKQGALLTMVSRMGVVTLFCNIAAAIGFAVFALTRSSILKEFGIVAGINIMVLFVISFILIPAVLSYLPAPKAHQMRYLHNPLLVRWLARIERWAMLHRKTVYAVTGVLLVVAVAGLFRLRSEGFIVDDLPKTDKIYTDLKFFEKHFRGVMPLEVLIDTKKKFGVTKIFRNLEKIDSLGQYLAARPEMARPLSLTEGLKFAKQAFYDGDSLNYGMPSSNDLPFLAPYLSMKADSTGKPNNFTRLLQGFVDTAKQIARISVNMADVGSARLPEILTAAEARAAELFPAADYNVQFTGTSVTFLEGSRFIIKGLKDSILWAFLLIMLCMLYLFRSVRILLCSLLPNIVPLVITAGVMGWMGVALKPSTVLVFSVALGIAIDITIRFLVNYKQELPQYGQDVAQTVQQTIRHTGISIIYTSLVLITGFVIFCFSGFGGTQALGWLTSLTLVVATLTNLVLLPVLLMSFSYHKKVKITKKQE
jgi:hypothetical protein